MELFNLRLEASKHTKSEDWTLDDLEAVLKKLKNGKSKDASEFVNELFKLENIGIDLKHSILIMMNSIKQEIWNYVKLFQFTKEKEKRLT